MLHFLHEQNYGHFKEKYKKKPLKKYMVKRDAFFNYTLSIAILIPFDSLTAIFVKA